MGFVSLGLEESVRNMYIEASKTSLENKQFQAKLMPKETKEQQQQQSNRAAASEEKKQAQDQSASLMPPAFSLTSSPAQMKPSQVAQREDGEEEQNNSSSSFQLQPPSLLGGGSGFGFQAPRLSLLSEEQLQFGSGELQLDPALMAQVRGTFDSQLSPSNFRSAFLNIDPSILGAPAAGPSPLSTDLPSTQEPLVPAGAGPDEPREASAGDLLSAITQVPAVEQTLDELKQRALSRALRDWNRLGTGGQVGLVSASAAIAIGAITPAMIRPDSRDFLLGQLNGRPIPVPGLGLAVELNTEGDNLMFGLHLDVGRFLPDSLGFGPSGANAIGAPPSPESSFPGN